MKSLSFWNKFPPSIRVAYLVVLGLFVLSLVAYAVAYFVGYSAVIHWQSNTTLEALPIAIDSFSRGLFTFRVEAENMFIKEMYQASEVQVNLWAAQIYFCFLIAAYIIALAVITALPKFWYYAGMLAFSLLIVTLNFDLLLLLLFNQANKYPAAVIIALYGALSYYFFAFKSDASFPIRLLSIAALTLVIGVVIYFESADAKPILFVTNLGIVGPIVITLVAIAINGFEVIQFFVRLTAGSSVNFDKTRLRNFVIISLLYLANLVLLLCKKLGVFDWDFLYLNMFLLLPISLVLGIWGYQKRSVLFQKILPFSPLGAFLYMAYVIVAISTICYAFITANQPLIDAFEYAILLIHVGFGALFFMYVLINFGFLFSSNISIYQILYVPRRFPFFTVHTGGALLILSLFFKLNMFPYFLTMSGYYNAVADYYQAIGDKLLSKEYYEFAAGNNRYNQRSNFSLATLFEKEGKDVEAQEYYGDALGKKATPYVYVNLANWYLRNDMLLQAMFTLRDGYKAFPQNPYIVNNLGLLFAQTNVADSTYHYLQIASANAATSVPVINMMSQLAKDGAYEAADSIGRVHSFKEEQKFQSNYTAVQNFLGKSYDLSRAAVGGVDSISPFEYATVLNKNINQVVARKIKRDSELDTLISHGGNDMYHSGLSLLRALKAYYGNDKQKGLDLLETLYHSTTNAHYAKMLAIWYYEQEAYGKAYEYFNNTIVLDGQQGVLNCCMALCEGQRYEEAKENLGKLSGSKSESIAAIARKLVTVFETKNIEETQSWNEALKYQFVHFRKNDFDLKSLETLANTIDTAFYHNLSKAEIILAHLDRGETADAASLWESIKNLPGENTFEKGMLNYTHLCLLKGLNDTATLQKVLPNIFLNSDKANTIPYWHALTLVKSAKPKLLKQKYLEAIHAAPMNASVIIDATRYIARHHSAAEAYELLTQAVKQNNESVPLLKEYALQAHELGFATYADDALLRLSDLMPASEFETFKKRFQAPQP